MSYRTRALFLSFSILALLALSAFGTIPAYADDGTTSGSTETTTTTGTGEDDASTNGDGEAPVVDSSTVGEVVPPADGSTPTPETEPEVATPPLLEQLPENTTVTVVDEAGEAQPLVSQESVEAVQLSDPIWCPEGQAPTPGENGCTASYSSFTELLDFLLANEGDTAYQQAGTIYVQQGAYLGGEESIDFNSYNFTNLNQQNLTVTGGWDPGDNSVDSTSEFDIPIIIGSSSNPWGGSITLNNIIINGVANQTGLTLYSNGDINLTNVEVSESQNGAELNAGGNVTVKNSKFKKNGSGVSFDHNGTDVAINPDATGAGLSIKGSAITLQEVDASNNQLYGADITATQTVTVTDSFFNGNISYAFPPTGSWEHYGYGIQVITDQNITLENVTANGNQLFGANLNGSTISVKNSSFNNNGSSFEEDPVGYGLNVKGTGAVTLQSVSASHNELFGANINAGETVTITQGFFDGNSSFEYVSNAKVYHGYGLQVVTSSFVNLSNISATENALLGAHLEGSSIAIATGTFSNNGTGSALDILGKGIEIVSTSAVNLYQVDANNNQAFGANIQAVDDVSISNSFFSGNKVYSYSCQGTKTTAGGGYGLLVTTSGDIALNVVETNNNYLYGSNLTGKDVSITTGYFNNNGSDVLEKPVGSGIEINSTGIVTINTIAANNNQIFGLDIETTGNVTINDGSFNYTQSLSHETDSFFGYGLTVVTPGTITMNQVIANYNFLWGGSLDAGYISVSNSQFNFNVSPSSVFIDDTGLLATSDTDVSLFNVEAKENRLIGAIITAGGNVFISQSNFSGNQGITCSIAWCPPGSEIYHGYGLNVTAGGQISLDGVTSSDNYLYGAHLEGSTVTVANSSFNNNGTGNNNSPEGRGLEVISGGTVTILWVEANNNQLFGANVQAQGDVTVTASDFIGNYHVIGTSPVGYGLQIITLGNITLMSDNNGLGLNGSQNGSGAILQGNNISVTDSIFDENGSGNGLTITATGTVELTNVTATSNGGNGVEVTTTGSCVQVTGGTFTGNAQYGIYVSGAPLNLDGTQTFSGNGAGDTFTDTLGTCVIAPPVVVTTPTTPSQVSTSSSTSGSSTVTNNSNSTSLSAGSTSNTTVASNTGKKTIKSKKVRGVKVTTGKRKHRRNR